ncbi:MAG: uroporphyrinogen-III C-methyltransferase [Coxiellaceae bacterium]|nr:MAG: uroporphyrinogen-III C-methyltransferase [Coxiellaceae bacterium]
MTELRALPPVDVVSLLAQLNALSQQITQLTVTNTEMQKTGSDHAPVTPSNTAEQSASVWHRAWNNVGHAFKQMVVVRHVDQPAQPLISPEQQAFLIENIQLKLAQAEWAALHRDVGVYQASLHQAQTWVQQYFANNAATQSVIATLNNLLQVNIKPDLPSLDDTIRAIQAALVKTINNQPTTTSSH